MGNSQAKKAKSQPATSGPTPARQAEEQPLTPTPHRQSLGTDEQPPLEEDTQGDGAMDAGGFVIKSKVPKKSVEFMHATQGLVKIVVQRNGSQFLYTLHKGNDCVNVSGVLSRDAEGKLKRIGLEVSVVDALLCIALRELNEPARPPRSTTKAPARQQRCVTTPSARPSMSKTQNKSPSVSTPTQPATTTTLTTTTTATSDGGDSTSNSSDDGSNSNSGWSWVGAVVIVVIVIVSVVVFRRSK